MRMEDILQFVRYVVFVRYKMPNKGLMLDLTFHSKPIGDDWAIGVCLSKCCLSRSSNPQST